VATTKQEPEMQEAVPGAQVQVQTPPEPPPPGEQPAQAVPPEVKVHEVASKNQTEPLEEQLKEQAPRPSVESQSTPKSIQTPRSASQSLGLSKDPQNRSGLASSRSNPAIKFILHPAFEMTIVSIIMFNAFVIAAENQYIALGVGNYLDYPRYTSTREEAWPHADGVFEFFDMLFGIIYVMELVLKMYALRCSWFRDVWNYFDFLIVGFWLFETVLDTKEPILPTNTTLLRTARLFKLLRLVKVIKTLQGFDSLYLIMTTLSGSMQILCWSVALLFVLQMLLALIMNFALRDYFENDHYPEQVRRDVFKYFGSFSRAMLTMFEMTLANWPPVCRLLVENVNEWFMLFCLGHKLTIGFAVIGVINGVFLQETFKVSATDDSIMMRAKERDVRVYGAKVSRLFQATDQDGDGVVDSSEFHTVMADPEISTWLSTMDLPVRDPVSLFKLLDADGGGSLNAEEMVRGVLRLRGAAKNVDMISLRKQMDHMQELLERKERASFKTPDF
jgi:hypothetical protein